MTSSIRKQVYDLKPNDLAKFPVWEFRLDEEAEPDQDEATISPYHVSDALDATTGMFIVAARFKLADGRQFSGYLTPPSSEDCSLGTIQPQIVTENGQVVFWCGVVAPDPTFTYKLLGTDAASMFPIHFESAVPLVGGSITGDIPGFLCLERDFETIRVVQ